MRRTAVALATIGVLGALPAAASAHAYTVYAGEPGPPPKSAPKGAELNLFMPNKLKVRAGDSVTYLNNAFHTVSILGKGVAFPPIAVPDGTATYSGINDPQGNPFFFNGLQKFKYNEAVFAPVGDTTIDDRETHSSGAFFPSQSGPGEYTLKFAKAGSYKVLCLLHPGMKQKVKVLKAKAKGADRDSKVKRRIARETRTAYKNAAKAAASKVPENTVYAGAERKNATLLAFLPGSLSVKAGTTVTFALKAPSEVHNMVWGDPAFVQKFQTETDLFPSGPGTPNQVSPPFVYGSEPATGPGAWTYSGNEYGNGFFWSPLMDDQPGNPPQGLPGTESITFDTPGTYAYFCAIHGPEMSGTIVVK